MTQKTPEYTRRAVQKYRENKDQINLVLDKGTKEKIEKLTGKKASAYIKALVMDDLQRMEAGNYPQDQDEKPTQKPQAVTDQEPTQESTQKPQQINPYEETDEQRKQRELAEIGRYYMRYN